MLWSVGKQLSPRGAGLGNEIFPWAKAYLGAQALGLKCVDPAWRLNPRRYDRQLGGNFLDSFLYVASQAMPKVEITSDLYHSAGTPDYFEAIQQLQDPHIDTKAPVLLHSSGMSGGYLGIRRAKSFLKRSILGSPDALQAISRLELQENPVVRVAVHVRGGDFGHADQVEAGVFNQALPLGWYRAQLKTLSDSLRLPIKVFLATDTKPNETADALAVGDERPAIVGTSSISDLAILASCDILVASVSSFSMLAAFLSDAPYVWHKDQLGESGGWLSIWGHESNVEGGGHTRRSAEKSAESKISIYRGLAQSETPTWPSSLVAHLEYGAFLRAGHTDLIHYGVVPSSGCAN